MNQALLKRKKPARRDPEASRQILIDATLNTIADIGITDATVSRIIERAGLSRGMIHLHFGGKDNLLTCAVEYFHDEYYKNMAEQIANANDSAADVILALVQADISEAIMNSRSVKIWHAFRGVSHSHPGIAKYTSTQDHELRVILLRAFTQIESEYDTKKRTVDAVGATFGTLALLEGMWVHYLSDMDGFSREGSVLLIRKFLAGLFPKHF